jgi:DNA-binding phage protein
LSADQVEAVRSRLATGAKLAQVARELGVTRQKVYAYLRTTASPASA